ncbi:Asp23/Gls24 family envelope stress response protein [Pseudonocardia sp. KRD291]|uniref:Asp23/Gls24 family envelope stress response protein n=1 Tax=Pseudonocardia sp. KRD291 TaxID=2792007 RepID=UPI001CF76EE7|nr:Asp23/Gls24 family envelope stress response protein [Pseudonocardia sp. KRD291]
MLACGRDAALVWDHAEAGVLDEHERTCPHCRSTVSDRDSLGGLVGRMAAQPLRPPPNVLEQVMGAVVADLRPHDLLVLAPGASLSRPAAAAALRHIVDSMDGLRARSCRIEQERPAPDPAPDGTDATIALPLRVTVTVAARFGVDLASVTARVRQMMISAGERALGVPVARVDIHVVDVWDEREDR